MKSILDPSFRYTPSTSTDVRKTFARIRRLQRAAAQGKAVSKDAPRGNLISIDKAKRGAVVIPAPTQTGG